MAKTSTTAGLRPASSSAKLTGALAEAGSVLESLTVLVAADSAGSTEVEVEVEEEEEGEEGIGIPGTSASARPAPGPALAQDPHPQRL